jgi:hypothetical protein
MARPRKYGEQRMDIHLRIPVTDEQKALIDRATADEVEGMAAWARLILLEAATRKIAKTEHAAGHAAGHAPRAKPQSK